MDAGAGPPDFSAYTLAEPILHLSSEGWTDMDLLETKKLEPCKLGSKKVWYHTGVGKTSKLYLHALAVAESRINLGLIKGVHHYEAQAHYRAIIRSRERQ